MVIQSSQILSTLGKVTYSDALNIINQPESDAGQAYTLLKNLFDVTKRIYEPNPTERPFISADDQNLREPEHRNIIRKSNLATFVASVFGSQDVGFFDLNANFLETFLAEGARLLKSQGALYLDLKTQAFISSMTIG